MQALDTPVDKRRIKGAQSRRVILAAAISCVATQGLSNTTLDKVAERAAVSRALVVFHFKSKGGLLREVLDFLGSRFSEGRQAVAALEPSSTMERLLLLCDYDVRFACENPEYLSAWHAFWGEANGNLLYHELSLPRDKLYANDFRRLLALLIEESGADPEELEPIHTGLSAMLFGLWVETHLNPCKDDYNKGMSAVRKFLSKMFPESPLPPV